MRSPNRIPPDIAAQAAGDPVIGEADAKEVIARIAMALGKLLPEIRLALEQLAREGPASEGWRGNLASLLNKVKRGDRFARELLAYSGRQQLAPEAVELLPLLCSVAHMLRCTLDQCINVTVQVDDDCPPCQVDMRALEEVLIHLAINARDAMPDGGSMHFAARLGRTTNGQPAVALTLRDSGIGMAADTARCAALPFFTTKTDDLLVGLGLAAVEGFVRQSGGSMELRTWAGDGTSVTLWLPLAAESR
jgi:C4-dicarboxylate-specific signal transduction histidine kinase